MGSQACLQRLCRLGRVDEDGGWVGEGENLKDDENLKDGEIRTRRS